MAALSAGLIIPRFGATVRRTGPPPVRWHAAACPVCTGDVHEADGGWGTCLICARTFPVVELLSKAREHEAFPAAPLATAR